jgi:hypothetical protein
MMTRPSLTLFPELETGGAVRSRLGGIVQDQPLLPDNRRAESQTFSTPYFRNQASCSVQAVAASFAL